MSGLCFRCFLPSTNDGELAADSVVTDRVWVQTGATPPPDLRDRVRFRQGFLPGTAILWVENEATTVLNPFWVPRHFDPQLIHVFPGVGISRFDATFAHSLNWAGALKNGASGVERSEALRARIRGAAASFAEHSFVNIGDVLHEGFVARLGAYYRELAMDAVRRPRRVRANQYGVHNEPVMRFVHHQVTALTSQIVGYPMMPSYSHFMGYVAGADLKPHTDRAQCEITISLLIDFDAPPSASGTWPIYLQSDRGVEVIHQRVGDMLVFNGQRGRHWRETLAEGHRSHSLLLHYVRETFCDSLN